MFQKPIPRMETTPIHEQWFSNEYRNNYIRDQHGNEVRGRQLGGSSLLSSWRLRPYLLLDHLGHSVNPAVPIPKSAIEVRRAKLRKTRLGQWQEHVQAQN